MAECPNNIEELQELEKLIPLCRATLYNQAKARIETGAAKSVSEASRQLANETGRSAETIRHHIRRADITGQLASSTGTDKHRPFASSQKTRSTTDDLLDDWQEPSQKEDAVEAAPKHEAIEVKTKADEDSQTLFSLKRLWQTAYKKEKTEFIKWVKERGEI